MELQKNDKAILISSYMLAELSGFCNKAAIMEWGRLVMAGTISELSQKLTSRKISVKWRADDDKARQILLDARPAQIEFVSHGAIFEFAGSMDDLDNILKTLVLEGVRVYEWRNIGDELEQIFVESGAREVV